MKTHFYLLLLLLLTTQVIFAESSSSLCVVVETIEGERMEYLLSDNPRIVHHDGLVTLTTNMLKVDLPTASVLKVYFSNSTTNIRKAKTAEGVINWQENTVVLIGFTANELVSLYSSDGRKLWQQATDGNGQFSISLNSLSQGIYIIKTNHQTLKISKK